MITWIWDNILLDPMINSLVILARLFFGNVGIAIIVFTILVRVATLPLTLRQLKSTRAMTALQPRLQEIQKKYKDPKRRSEETMKIYREAGVNPLGCLGPMLIQFPIWIALYQALRQLLGATPEAFIGLSQRLYPWSYIRNAIPLEEHFLWMNLGSPDPVMPVLVGISTYLQQKLMTTPSLDPRQQSMNNTMTWMMPLMFAWFTLAVPSGLALYWVTTNMIGFLMAYFVYGTRTMTWRQILLPVPAPAPAARPAQPQKPAPVGAEDDEPETDDGRRAPHGGRPTRKRQKRRRSRS
jgi:YidC/Oxa1 family membrane protein insertase